MAFTVLGMGLGKLASAVLPAAASLIGGNADRKQRNKELAMQDPVYMRKRYEAAGLNPALIGGSTPLQGLGYAPSFGSTMSSAVNMFLNTRSEQEQLEIQKTQLEQENQRLEQLAQRAVLRPSIGGVYSRNGNNSVPRSRPVGSRSHGQVDGSDTVGGIPTPEVGRNTVTNASTLGSGNYADPSRPDAETGEARGGDIISNLTGAAALLSDRRYSIAIKNYSRLTGERPDAIHERFAANPNVNVIDDFKSQYGYLDDPELLPPEVKETRLGPDLNTPVMRERYFPRLSNPMPDPFGFGISH